VLIEPISGRFRAASKKPGQVVCQKLDILAGAILQDKRKTAGSADAWYRRRGETEDGSRRQLPEFLVQTRLDGLKLLGPVLSLIPRLQSDPKEGVVTYPDVAEQTETNHAGGVLDARRVCKNLFYLCRRRACAFLRGCIGKLHVDI